MSWADGYLQAKFRGVPFFIRRATKNTGRRNVAHVYPRKDLADHEDLGNIDRTFDLDAYVLGDDYYDQRNALEAAFEEGGEGILIHPYRGVLRVVVNEVTTNEVTEEGGKASFTVKFSLQDEVKLTSAAPNTRQQVAFAKAEVLAQTKAWFLDFYDLINKPAQAIADARAALDKGLSVVDKAKRVAGALADFRREIENTQGRIIALSLNAEFIADSFIDFINWATDPGSFLIFGSTPGNARDQLREQRQISTFSSGLVVSTPERLSQDPGYPSRQIQTLVGYASVGAQIGLMTEIPFSSVSDAEETQDELFETMDGYMEDENITDSLYEALREAKRAVYDDLQRRIISLPTLIDFSSPQAETSLSLNYKMYGDLDNEQDFIDRNDLIHPGFVPVGTLQVRVFDE